MTAPLLFLIPARAGSKRVPGKNLRRVGGMPLVGRAARTARLAAAGLPGGPHAVVCSTDDPEIAAVATAWGADALDRPRALATDAATSVGVALDALDRLEAAGHRFRALVLVQPTSPLTEPDDLRAAVERFDTTGDPVVSVTPAHPASWHQSLDPGTGRLTTGPTTDAAQLLAGAFYVVSPDELRRTGRFVEPGRTVGVVVPPDRSVDIDEPHELAIAEALLAARPVRDLEIDGRGLGGPRVFVIAEAGVNHNGDIDLAHQLVDAAASTGADAVKFQTFDPDALAAAGAPMADYQRTVGHPADDQRAMLAALVLPRDAWPALRDRARDRGMVFLSTPFDDASADLFDDLGVPAFKVGSGELTNIPFLTRLARRGRPMLVSTGMADMVEVAAAVDAIRAAGDPSLGLLHCVSSYPAEPRDANLRAIATLRAAFGVPTGWSDHTRGIELPVAAVALGASIVEKHLTLDRSLPGPDHRASLDPASFAAMVAAIRATEAALGSGEKRPVDAERAIAQVARRSLHWARSLPAGAPIGGDDLVALRPGSGLPPARAAAFLGRSTARPVTAGAIVAAADVDGPA